MTELQEVRDGKIMGKKLLPECAKQKCRGVFHYREPLLGCFIPTEKDAMQLIGGTGPYLRD